jgi:hypothetical protein
MDLALVRRMWIATEHVHLVTYFAPEARAAYEAVGVRGFWRGYFGSRAAPMGAVGPGAVVATFYGFDPEFVDRSVPGVWDMASPSALIGARVVGARGALEPIVVAGPEETAAIAASLDGALRTASPAGRTLFAANLDVAAPDDPVGALWQACTLWREHRGDGHVAALVAAGLDGCESHVLRLAVAGGDAGLMRAARGWSDDDWAGAVDRLAGRGLLVDETTPADDGRELIAIIEATTDRLAATPIESLGPDGVAVALALLEPIAHAVRAAMAMPDPNPIGVPAPTRSA